MPRHRWLPRILFGAACVVALLLAWAAAGFLVVNSGVATANHRLPRAARTALDPQHGSPLTSASDILLLSVDHAEGGSVERQTDDNSDAMMILHSEPGRPGRHRLVYLSIPRDLRVEVGGCGEQKINSAMQFGGPGLAIRAVEQLTGPPRRPRRDRRLLELRAADRGAWRRRDRHPREHPLQPLRLPLRDPGPLSGLAGVALPQGAGSASTPSATSSTRASATTGSTPPTPT